MARQIVAKDLKIEEFEFVDVDGNYLFTIKFNPADLRLAERGKEFIKWYNNISMPENAGEKEVEALSDELLDRIDTFLGTKQASDIRDLMHPFSVLPDGQIYIEVAVNNIVEFIQSELDVRIGKINNRIKKYTDKYNK